MSVLTQAWAAIAVGGVSVAAVEAEPAEPQQAGAQGDEGHVVGQAALAGGELALAHHEHRGQGRIAGAHVDHRAAGPVTHAVLGEPAAAPDPVDERDVDDDAPQHEEPEVALELDAVGEGAGDERRGDDGEHLLVDEVRLGGDGRGPGARKLPYVVKHHPVKVADDPADVARERQRVAEEHPDGGHDAHRDERLHHDRQEVLAAYEPAVEECETGRHQRD